MFIFSAATKQGRIMAAQWWESWTPAANSAAQTWHVKPRTCPADLEVGLPQLWTQSANLNELCSVCKPKGPFVATFHIYYYCSFIIRLAFSQILGMMAGDCYMASCLFWEGFEDVLWISNVCLFFFTRLRLASWGLKIFPLVTKRNFLLCFTCLSCYNQMY